MSKARRLIAYTDRFGEDFFLGQGMPADNGYTNWELAKAVTAAGDDIRALDYLEAAYAGGMIRDWRSTYGGPHFYALWDHPRHKALMARIEADMDTERAAMAAEGAADE